MSPKLSKPARTPLSSRLVTRMHAARFFSVSLFVHLFLGAFLGGLILFKSSQRSDIFVGANPGFLDATDSASPDDIEEEPTEFTEAEAQPPPQSTAALSASAITTLSTASMTTIQASVPLQTSGSSFIPQISTRGASASPNGGSGGSSGSRAAANGKMKMTSFFGSKENNGTGLVGYFYDTKQSPGRKETGATIDQYRESIREFANTWDTALLKEYYKAKQPLYTAQVLISIMPADEAPKAFGVEKEVQPKQWFVHYTGTVSAPESGTFRFAGTADDILVVAIDKKVVFDGCRAPMMDGMQPRSPWFKLSKGKQIPIDILVGEQPGGGFGAYLLIQKEEQEQEPARPVQFASAAMPDLKLFNYPMSDKPYVFNVETASTSRSLTAR